MSRLPRAATTLIAAAALSAAPVTSASAATDAPDAGRRPPRIVTAWACAWNGTDPEELGALFTADGVYTDLGVGVAFHGRREISGWKARADRVIDDIHVTVRAANRDGGRITVETVYAGHLKGARTAFAVPMTTLLDLDDHGLIASDQDHYSLAEILTRSGLPADWTPPAH
ncbi:nuclear transport factor 2 family protein [Kitasatospora sp. NPDC097643]|uniref:nuclear transport factor 2 family protein n=1 Tax=Kitasatospora sp. NPDC097643 TaxID=3157230 RepID=UPI003326B1A1